MSRTWGNFEDYAFLRWDMPYDIMSSAINRPIFSRRPVMYFDSFKSVLFSDTPVPDIFMTEYLPTMDSDLVKIYVYCVFLSKYNKRASVEELAKKLDIDLARIKDGILHMENLGIIKVKDSNISLVDLKEKEINRIYRVKTTSTPEEAAGASDRNKKRQKTINAINKTFFQGLMPPSWYTDIDAWFDKYRFDEDVMFTLFQHCFDHKGLSKNYIIKVADSWQSKQIQNAFDVDRYIMEYQKLKGIYVSIARKLNLSRFLTEYEEEYVEKWVLKYGFEFDIIEMALKKTTAKTNPNFNYLDTILKNWHENKLTTREAIEDLEKQKRTEARKKTSPVPIPQKANFEQRQYNDEFYESLYINQAGEK